jgi:hypothetical protein
MLATWRETALTDSVERAGAITMGRVASEAVLPVVSAAAAMLSTAITR